MQGRNEKGTRSGRKKAPPNAGLGIGGNLIWVPGAQRELQNIGPPCCFAPHIVGSFRLVKEKRQKKFPPQADALSAA